VDPLRVGPGNAEKPSKLDEAKKEGPKIKLTGVPAFIVNNKQLIVGDQTSKGIYSSSGHGYKSSRMRFLSFLTGKSSHH